VSLVKLARIPGLKAGEYVKRIRLAGGFQMGVIKPCRKSDYKPGHPICLYTKRKPHVLLGRHRSRASALKQERMIQWMKKRRRA
jgi:hypothetical protein